MPSKRWLWSRRRLKCCAWRLSKLASYLSRSHRTSALLPPPWTPQRLLCGIELAWFRIQVGLYTPEQTNTLLQKLQRVFVVPFKNRTRSTLTSTFFRRTLFHLPQGQWICRWIPAVPSSPSAMRFSQSPEFNGGLTSHWFPFIRPAIKPCFFLGGMLGGCRLTSHNNKGIFWKNQGEELANWLVSLISLGKMMLQKKSHEVWVASCFFFVCVPNNHLEPFSSGTKFGKLLVPHQHLTNHWGS